MSREATHIAGWTRTRLGHAFDIELGKMLSPEASVGRDLMPYLANRNVQWNQLDLDDLGYMNFARAERERFRLRSGDLLICEGGEIGRTAIWNDELPECYFQKAIHRLRPRTATIESRLLLHYMRYAVDHNLFPGLIGQTSIAHLTREKLIQFELGHPVSIREQRRITEILDALDDQIAESTCLIAKELSLREGVLRQLSNLYFHATTMSTLAQVSLLITSGSRGWAGYYADHGALFVRIGNLTREHINLRLDDCVFVQVPKTSEGSRAALTPGDILISITADLGIIGMVPDDLGEAYINQHVRSEEHTSELQSRSDLVCRLLLEKKKEQARNSMLIQKKKTKNKKPR